MNKTDHIDSINRGRGPCFDRADARITGDGWEADSAGGLPGDTGGGTWANPEPGEGGQATAVEPTVSGCRGAWTTGVDESELAIPAS